MNNIIFKIKAYFKNFISKKRTIYFISLIVLVLLTIVLNMTYSAFSSDNISNAANIKVAGMEYNMTINGSPGSIITATQNQTTKSNINIISLNNLDSKYELIYDICSDSSCNNFIEKPEGLTIEYSSKTTDEVSGIINSGGSKNIRIIVINETETTYYLKLGINAGYAHNTLALLNLITGEYNEEDLIIKAFVYGEPAESFPAVQGNYETTVECSTNGGTSNATGTATWNGTKWVVDITGLDSGRTICNVNFDLPLLKTMILGVNNANVTTPLTTPGRAISTSGEAVLASTADDYGTSYYYRGAVENNYVEFAGMCWRIVRVVGDGSIKLVLYNYNPNSVENPCDESQDGSSNAFARYSGETYKSKFNTSYTRNAYVGFMYGTPNSSTYALSHANNTKSTILTNLETWYNRDNQFASYEHLLADTIWCNDKSMSTASTYLGYGTNTTYYKAYQRLITPASANPSLECPDDIAGEKLSKFTVDDTENGNHALDKKIGLLTIDEVAYAGGINEKTNSSYYLNKNATGTTWWSLSPSSLVSSTAGVWAVSSTGYLFNVVVYGSDVSEARGLRPAVSLVSTTKITGGEGTSSSPYIVLTN